MSSGSPFASASPTATSSQSARNVLVVDDDPGAAYLLCEWLAEQGHGTRRAANGAQAIRLLEDETFVALITDLRMPGCDGVALVRWCREYRPGLPIVVFSGYPREYWPPEAADFTPTLHVTKPLDDATERELLAVLDRARATAREK